MERFSVKADRDFIDRKIGRIFFARIYYFDSLAQTPKFVTQILAGVLIGLTFLQSTASAAGPLLIAYGGFNETMAPLWIGIERGLFHKYGVDVAVLQTRSGQIMMTTLATGGAALVWAAPSSAVSSSAAGMKLGCFAAGNNKLPRELIVRRGIESIEDLRGKTFGVQSIGGGAWLSTMVALDGAKGRLAPARYMELLRSVGFTPDVQWLQRPAG